MAGTEWTSWEKFIDIAGPAAQGTFSETPGRTQVIMLTCGCGAPKWLAAVYRDEPKIAVRCDCGFTMVFPMLREADKPEVQPEVKSLLDSLR